MPKGTARATSFTALAAALLIAAAVVVVYSNTFSSPFTFDDGASIVDNPSIRRLWPLWVPLSPPVAGGITVAGRPVLNLSLAVNHAISGSDVWSYHLANLSIHLFAALALFGIARRTLATRAGGAHPEPEAAWMACAIALIWAVHPLQTEAVTYVVQRAESLMGLFYLATVYCFIRYAEADDLGKPGAAAAWAALSWIACLLGMGTKEVMASAPFVVLLWDRTFAAGSFREAWNRRRVAYIILAVNWILLAGLIFGNGGNRGGTIGFGHGVGVSWWKYALSQFHAIFRYLRLSLWPHPQVFDYGTIWAAGLREVAPHALVVVLLAAATCVALVRRPAFGFLGFWFFAILAPSSSVIPGNRQTISEHRMYLPLAAIAALAVVAARARLGRLGAGVALGAAAAALGAAAWSRNEVYRSEITLYRDTLAQVPANPYSHSDYGNALLKAGRAAEAAAEFAEAIRLKPDYEKARYNLGAALDAEGRYAEALEAYKEAVRLNPNDATAHNNMANTLIQLGRRPEALEHFAAALRADPDFSVVHYNYANTLASVGRAKESLPHYAAALRRQPEMAEAHNNYGIALCSVGQLDEGIREFETAIRLRPDQIAARYNLGNACLVTHRYREAIAQYEAVLRLDPGYAAAQRNLEVAKSRL